MLGLLVCQNSCEDYLFHFQLPLDRVSSKFVLWFLIFHKIVSLVLAYCLYSNFFHRYIEFFFFYPWNSKIRYDLCNMSYIYCNLRSYHFLVNTLNACVNNTNIRCIIEFNWFYKYNELKSSHPIHSCKICIRLNIIYKSEHGARGQKGN
jgi:hypothetical protein